MISRPIRLLCSKVSRRLTGAARSFKHQFAVFLSLIFSTTPIEEALTEHNIETKKRGFKYHEVVPVNRSNSPSDGTFTPNNVQIFANERHPVYVLHEATIDPSRSLINGDVTQDILQSGAKILVLRDEHQSTKHVTKLLDQYPSQVLTLDSPLPLTRWVQNYLGTLVKDPDGFKVVGFDIGQGERTGDTYSTQILAAALGVESRVLPIKMHGSSFLKIADSTFLVSRKIMYDNPRYSIVEINHYLQQLGINNPIWSPWMPGEPGGHLDLCVGVVDDKIFVPTMNKALIEHAQTSNIELAAQEALDRISLILRSKGFKVGRLLMPPLIDQKSLALLPYYSPVNWICLPDRHRPNRHRVIIPVPSDETFNPTIISHCQDHNRAVLEEQGIRVDFVETSLPSLGGGFHCVVKKITIENLLSDMQSNLPQPQPRSAIFT